MSELPDLRIESASGPFVSVLVPTYKRDELLCNTIRCLLGQDYSACEIIVVDQCPEHDRATRDFLLSVQDRIKYFVLDRPNVSAARNFAFQQSRGDLIVCVDDDMEIPHDVLSRVVQAYSNEEISGMSLTILQDDSSLKSAEREGFIRTIHFSGQFMSFRRKVFDTIGGFYEWFGAQRIPSGEDADFTYRAIQHGFKLFVNQAIAVRHCGNRAMGGCERTRLGMAKEVSDVDMFSGLVVYWRNRAPGFRGSVAAFWRGYHSYVLNLELIRKLFRGSIAKNRRFFRLFSDVLKEPWLNNAQ